MSNVLGAIGGIVTGVTNLDIIQNACYGDKACQENRDAKNKLKQSEVDMQTKALDIAGNKEDNTVTILIVVGIIAIILVAVVFYMSKKK